MGFFKSLKQASNFEREFLAKKSLITDLNAMTPETIALENFAIKYDGDRYVAKLNKSFSKSELEQEMAYTFEGLAAFYDTVLEEGVDKWLDKKYATEKWEEFFTLKMSKALKNDMHGALWCYGFQIGIMCFIEGILYYDLNVFPLVPNPTIIGLRNQYDALEKTNGKEIVERTLKKQGKQ